MIRLRDIWLLEQPESYKIHFATWNGENEPIEVMARSMDEWRGWQAYYPGRNDWNRPYIFSLAKVPKEYGCWLFGGIFQVHGLEGGQYNVELLDTHKSFIQRLKLCHPYRGMQRRLQLENYLQDFTVKEILSEAYRGQRFPGYANVDISFDELLSIISNTRADWLTALTNIKAVYMITDVHSGRKYVGSAYGNSGLWSRWAEYVRNGHGNNARIVELLNRQGLSYAQQHFRFSILEVYAGVVDDQTVIRREHHWQSVLLTRGDFGYNNGAI